MEERKGKNELVTQKLGWETKNRMNSRVHSATRFILMQWMKGTLIIGLKIKDTPFRIP